MGQFDCTSDFPTRVNTNELQGTKLTVNIVRDMRHFRARYIFN